MNRALGDTKKQYTQVRAVLFDAVGTLFRSRGTIGEIYCEIARAHGLVADPGQVEERFRRQVREQGTPLDKAGWKGLVRSVFSGLGPFPDFDTYFEDVYAAFQSSLGWRCYPETVPVLETLRNTGYTLGIVSNFDRRLYSVLRDLRLDAFFQTVTTPDSSGYAKPDPRIFLAATEAIGVDPSEAVFAGDEEIQDFEGASRAGLRAVLVVRDGPIVGPTERIRDLSEIPPLLEALQI